MVMTSHDAALVIAGLTGSFSAVIHGMLTQSHLVDPVRELTPPGSARRSRGL